MAQAPASNFEASASVRTQSYQEALWALARFGISILIISLILGLMAAPWLELSLWKILRRSVSIAAAISLWLCITRFERRTLHSYGLSNWTAGKRQLRFGLMLGVGSLATMLVLGLAIGLCDIAVTEDHLKLWRTVLGFIPAAFIVSILEEMVFRGFILQHLAACSTSLAVVVSSGLYSIVHLKGATLTSSTWLELGGLFLFGAVLAASYFLTHQLYLGIGLHAALAYGARVNKLLIQFSDQSLSWLTGTSRLVNGLLGWAVLLAMGAAIVWWAKSTQQGGVHEKS